jgi:hypothetical protein
MVGETGLVISRNAWGDYRSDEEPTGLDPALYRRRQTHTRAYACSHESERWLSVLQRGQHSASAAGCACSRFRISPRSRRRTRWQIFGHRIRGLCALLGLPAVHVTPSMAALSPVLVLAARSLRRSRRSSVAPAWTPKWKRRSPSSRRIRARHCAGDKLRADDQAQGIALQHHPRLAWWPCSASHLAGTQFAKPRPHLSALPFYF